MKKKFLVIALGLIAVGCSPDKPSIDVACKPPYDVRIYHEGRPSSTFTITNSPLCLKIQDWLKTNPNDWHTSYITFAPGIEIRNNDMTLNFTVRFAVLNIKNSSNGKWEQFIREVDMSTIGFLREIIIRAESPGARGSSVHKL